MNRAEVKETPPSPLLCETEGRGPDAKEKSSKSYFVPEQCHRDVLIAAAVFAVTFVYLLPFLRFTVLNADEGITLYGAERILRGQVLYRDFFAFYTPGSYYLDALVMRLFGNSIAAMRLMLIGEGAALSTVNYLLARRSCGTAISCAAAGIVTLGSLPLSFYVQHSWDSSLVASMAVYSAVRLIEESSTWRSMCTGLLFALSILFEQSRGAGLCLGLALAVWASWGKKTPCLFSKKLSMGFFVGFVVPLAATLSYFAWKGTAAVMIKDWFWPLRHYALTNRLPYGYIPFAIGQYEELLRTPVFWRLFAIFVGSSLFLVSAIPVFGIGIFAQLQFRRDRRLHGPDPLSVLTCLILGLWIATVLGRRDYQHFAYILPLSVLFLAWIVDGVVVPRSFRVLRSFLLFWGLGSFALISLSMLLAADSAGDKIATRRGTLFSSGSDNVVSYVQSKREIGQQLFIYPYQPLYYYLTGVSNPTRYDYLQPGLHSESQLQSAIRDLERNYSAPVLFSSSFAEIISIPWPSTPEKIIATPDVVSLYIARHYRVCQSLTSNTNGHWTWLYMVRLNTPCPV